MQMMLNLYNHVVGSYPPSEKANIYTISHKISNERFGNASLFSCGLGATKYK